MSSCTLHLRSLIIQGVSSRYWSCSSVVFFFLGCAFHFVSTFNACQYTDLSNSTHDHFSMSSSNSQFKIPSKKVNCYGPLPEVPLHPDLLKFMPSDICSQFVSQNTMVDEQITHTETHLWLLVTPCMPAFESSVWVRLSCSKSIKPDPTYTTDEAPNLSGSFLLPPLDIPLPFQHSQSRLQAPKQTQAEIQSPWLNTVWTVCQRERAICYELVRVVSRCSSWLEKIQWKQMEKTKTTHFSALFYVVLWIQDTM